MAESTNRGYSNAVASFTIDGTNQVIRAGDCVLIRPSLHGADGLPCPVGGAGGEDGEVRVPRRGGAGEVVLPPRGN
ncbi:unnamed protein product [Urochloa humidicola]